MPRNARPHLVSSLGEDRGVPCEGLTRRQGAWNPAHHPGSRCLCRETHTPLMPCASVVERGHVRWPAFRLRRYVFVSEYTMRPIHRPVAARRPTSANTAQARRDHPCRRATGWRTAHVLVLFARKADLPRHQSHRIVTVWGPPEELPAHRPEGPADVNRAHARLRYPSHGSPGSASAPLVPSRPLRHGPAQPAQSLASSKRYGERRTVSTPSTAAAGDVSSDGLSVLACFGSTAAPDRERQGCRGTPS